jgi:hypothetical protein
MTHNLISWHQNIMLPPAPHSLLPPPLPGLLIRDLQLESFTQASPDPLSPFKLDKLHVATTCRPGQRLTDYPTGGALLYMAPEAIGGPNYGLEVRG